MQVPFKVDLYEKRFHLIHLLTSNFCRVWNHIIRCDRKVDLKVCVWNILIIWNRIKMNVTKSYHKEAEILIYKGSKQRQHSGWAITLFMQCNTSGVSLIKHTPVIPHHQPCHAGQWQDSSVNPSIVYHFQDIGYKRSDIQNYVLFKGNVDSSPRQMLLSWLIPTAW